MSLKRPQLITLVGRNAVALIEHYTIDKELKYGINKHTPEEETFDADSSCSSSFQKKPQPCLETNNKTQVSRQLLLLTLDGFMLSYMTKQEERTSKQIGDYSLYQDMDSECQVREEINKRQTLKTLIQCKKINK